MSDRLLTTSAAAERLGLSAKSLRELIRQKHLRAVTQPVMGRGGKPRKYVASSELDRYIAGRKDASTEMVIQRPSVRPMRSPVGLRKELAERERYL